MYQGVLDDLTKEKKATQTFNMWKVIKLVFVCLIINENNMTITNCLKETLLREPSEGPVYRNMFLTFTIVLVE